MAYIIDVYNVLNADDSKLEYQKNYYRSKAIKVLKAERKFPACVHYNYESVVSNNKYVIFFYAENRTLVNTPISGYFCSCYKKEDDKSEETVLYWGKLPYKSSSSDNYIVVPAIFEYSKHSMERYAERFLKNKSLSLTEIACRYLSRNSEYFIPIEQNENINRKYSKYGEDGKILFRVRDGVCATRIKQDCDSIIVIITSFMNESGMAHSQIKAMDKQHLDWYKRFCAK
ncbi:MAG: hypothetical protein IJD72_05690 [Alistipes sp.]|nr:hypothetical protein [Alistipes sp.]